MLRVGQLPDQLRSELDAGGVLAIGESVSVVCRFSGSVPGRFSSSSVSRSSGALALTSDRVVATLTVRSDPAVRAVDCRWDAVERGAMNIEISGDGLQLDLDVRRVDPRFHGRLSLHYKYPIDGDVLARLPRTSLRQDVSAEFVCHALGVRTPNAP